MGISVTKGTQDHFEFSVSHPPLRAESYNESLGDQANTGSA